MSYSWAYVSLGEVCRIKPPKQEAKELLKETDMVSFVPMKNLGIREKFFSPMEERPFEKVSGSYTYFADGDVLLAKITPCFENGKLGIARNLINGVGFGSSEFIVFRPKAGLNPEYLFYYLSQDSFRDIGQRVMTGAVGHKRVPKDFIENHVIPLPSVQEQKRLVTTLDEAFASIDAAIANTEKNLANARELFDNFLQTALQNAMWEWKRLGELCGGVEYGSSTKSKDKGSVPVMRMGNIQEGKLSWGDLKYSDDEVEIGRYRLKYDDVLFNRTNSPELVGKTAIYKSERPAIFAGYLIRIHRKEEFLDANYLNYFLNSKIARDYGKSVMTSSVNQANINGTKLKEYPIPVPKLSQQKALVQRFNELFNEVKCLEAIYQQKNSALGELKQSLLQKTFSGELTAEKAESEMDESVA